MARYLGEAAQLGNEVDSFVGRYLDKLPPDVLKNAVVHLGHIVNASVLCNPRKPQGTVRANIVSAAMKGHCKVSMTKENYDDDSGRTFNKIHIDPKSNTTD